MKKATKDEALLVKVIEDEWNITSMHPMTKTHYISFVAFVTGGSINLVKQYPEWELNIRIPKKGHGTLIWYCIEHGLFYQFV